MLLYNSGPVFIGKTSSGIIDNSRSGVSVAALNCKFSEHVIQGQIAIFALKSKLVL